MVIGAPVADGAVGDRDPMPGLDPVGRPLALAGELPLCTGKPPLGDAQVPGVGDRLDGAVAGGDGGKGGQAKVDPGSPRHGAKRGRVALDHERGVEAAVRLADDGDSGGY
jgi:hypothetical protein